MANKPDSFSDSLALAVKSAREKRGLTQKGLAEAIDIDSRTILEIENGRGNPKMEVLFPLVRFLNVDARDIFYPEISRDNPQMQTLRLMVEACTEAEAEVMISVFESVLKAIRSPDGEAIKSRK